MFMLPLVGNGPATTFQLHKTACVAFRAAELDVNLAFALRRLTTPSIAYQFVPQVLLLTALSDIQWDDSLDVALFVTLQLLSVRCNPLPYAKIDCDEVVAWKLLVLWSSTVKLPSEPLYSAKPLFLWELTTTCINSRNTCWKTDEQNFELMLVPDNHSVDSCADFPNLILLLISVDVAIKFIIELPVITIAFTIIIWIATGSWKFRVDESMSAATFVITMLWFLSRSIVVGILHQLDECEIHFVADMPVFFQRKIADLSSFENTFPAICSEFDPEERTLPTNKDATAAGEQKENDNELIPDDIVSVKVFEEYSEFWEGLLTSAESDFQLDDSDFVDPMVTALHVSAIPNESPLKFNKNDPVREKKFSTIEMLWEMIIMSDDMNASLWLQETTTASFIRVQTPDFAKTAECEIQSVEGSAVLPTFAHALIETPAPVRTIEKAPEAGMLSCFNAEKWMENWLEMFPSIRNVVSKIDNTTAFAILSSAEAHLEEMLLEENHRDCLHAVCPNLVFNVASIIENPDPCISIANDSVVGRSTMIEWRNPAMSAGM
jgi:hypothetical protein